MLSRFPLLLLALLLMVSDKARRRVRLQSETRIG